MMSNSDLQKWQQSIQGIEAAQNDLSTNERLAFKTLLNLFNNGNFEASESNDYIQTLKNSTTKNRLLKKAHLPNFIALCEKYFKVKPPTFESPVEVTAPPKPQIEIPVEIPPQQPIVFPENPTQKTGSPRKKNNAIVIITGIVIVLLLGYVVVKDSEWFNHFFQKEKEQEENALPENLNDTTSIETSSPILVQEVDTIVTDTIAEPVIISVTGVSLDATTQTLKIGDSFQLTATVHPPDATDKKVIWESNNPTVAIVDREDGRVTAKDTGSATITVTTQDGGKTAICNISVEKTPSLPPPDNAKNYSFGKYTGSLKNGIPEGDGKMTYNRRVQIAKHDTENSPHYAESGDYFIGSWGNGDIISGYLYDKNGNIKERIIAPKRFNPYDISKD